MGSGKIVEGSRKKFGLCSKEVCDQTIPMEKNSFKRNTKDSNTYLEDGQKYRDFFGNDSKTSFCVKQLTKYTTFEVFATWMHQKNHPLELSEEQNSQI
ncbi:hypothetical protein VP01_1600g1 [Puccinia sorghi]|uniref:Uncharacterized protein n=1 Tax=Puccinia sorghi TaxID=27349 RepID=A0A0L6VHA5_9BASI|nr:hypothetical protein VP01_1600g1 [Puccinia sorghi]